MMAESTWDDELAAGRNWRELRFGCVCCQPSAAAGFMRYASQKVVTL
jgi:hypothetical protein